HWATCASPAIPRPTASTVSDADAVDAIECRCTRAEGAARGALAASRPYAFASRNEATVRFECTQLDWSADKLRDQWPRKRRRPLRSNLQNPRLRRRKLLRRRLLPSRRKRKRPPRRLRRRLLQKLPRKLPRKLRRRRRRRSP